MATQDALIPEARPLAEAPRDLPSITSQEHANTLPYWNATVAFQLGIALRTRLLAFEKPTVINISTISEPGHVLFHAVTHSGTELDNDFWVKRKRNAVIRFGCSTWFLQNKFGGDEEGFARKMGLGGRASEVSNIRGVLVRGVADKSGLVCDSRRRRTDFREGVRYDGCGGCG
jgi:hypothetical protein